MKINYSVYPINLLDKIKSYQRTEGYINRKSVPKFVFLCGKGIDNDDHQKSNRFLTREYFNKHGNNQVIILLAEDIWNRSSIDLLTYERYLGEISDAIILFLESMGTAAELGAFSMDKELSSKMVVIIDKEYQDDQSFINDGPVKKIITNTNNEKVLFANLKTPFENELFRKHLSNIAEQTKMIKPNNNEKSVNINTYIVELINLTFLIGPVHEKELIYVYRYIKGFKEGFDFSIPSFKHDYAINILKRSGALIYNEHGYVYPDTSKFSEKLLFEISSREYNYLRAQFLARKYKYLDYNEFFIKETLTYVN